MKRNTVDFRLFLRLWAALVLIVCSNTAIAQDWKLKKDDDGIRVYTKKTTSPYDMFKVEMTCDCNMDGLIYLFKDEDGVPLWMERVEEFKIIENPEENKWSSWSAIDMPWPLEDRDLISDMWMDEVDGGIKINMTSQPEKVKKKDEYNRIVTSQGFWFFKKMENGLVRVIGEFFTIPQGIPAWIVNNFLVETPYLTALHIREMMTEEPYRSVKLDYLH